MDLLEAPGIERWEVASKAAELIAGQLAQLHSELVDLMAQVLETNAWSGGGIASPEHWLMLRCALSPARAKEIVDVARRRGDFPELEARMAEGAVSLDQLAVVARHVPSTHAATVSSFVEAATVPQLRRVLPKYPFPEKEPAPHPAGYEPLPEVVHVDPPIHDEPTLTMSTYDGRFRLHFEADPLDGALVEQAIREAKDALFTAGDADATLAEGLLSVASRSLSTVESISRREHYKVLVHLDVDGHGWMNRRGTLPTHLLRKLTCDGTVRPIWIENASPVSVGRSMRIVPPRTRKLIEDRDGGCRFPGCVTTGFLENHHLVPWSEGGATDVENLASLCPRHHRELHQGHFTISGNPSTPGGLIFRDRFGTIGRHVPQTIPPPTHPPPAEQPIRGWRLDTGSIDFEPRRSTRPLELAGIT